MKYFQSKHVSTRASTNMQILIENNITIQITSETDNTVVVSKNSTHSYRIKLEEMGYFFKNQMTSNCKEDKRSFQTTLANDFILTF